MLLKKSQRSDPSMTPLRVASPIPAHCVTSIEAIQHPEQHEAKRIGRRGWSSCIARVRLCQCVRTWCSKRAKSSLHFWIFLIIFACRCLTWLHLDISVFCLTQQSAICVETEEEIRALLLNQDQLKSGLEGNAILPNDCKALVQENVMQYRSEEAQKALCDNSCYATLNEKYKVLLDNSCFSSGDSDQDASGRLFAAAYQLACQTTIDGDYCGSGCSLLPIHLEVVCPLLTPYPCAAFPSHCSSDARRFSRECWYKL